MAGLYPLWRVLAPNHAESPPVRPKRPFGLSVDSVSVQGRAAPSGATDCSSASASPALFRRRRIAAGPPELRPVLALIVPLAVVCIAITLSRGLPHVAFLTAASLTLLMAVSDAVEIPLSIGSMRVRVVFVEAAVFLSFGLLGGRDTVVLSTLAVAAAELFHRRTLSSRCFNTSNHIIGTSLGSLALLSAPSAGGLGDPVTWSFLFAAIFIRLAAVAAVVAWVMSKMRKTPLRVQLRDAIPRNLASGGTSFALLLPLLLLYKFDTGALVVMPVVLAGFLLISTRYLQTRSERDVLRRLSEVSRPSRTQSLAEVVHEICDRACTLFGHEEVTLDLIARPDTQMPWLDGDQVHVPLHAGRPVGVLRMSWPPIQGPLTEADTGLMTTFGTTAAVMILNAEQHRTISQQADAAVRQARTDDITGLPNRVGLAELAPAALAGATEENGVALLLMDLDHFQEVNDGLGHRTGDELIRQVAERLVMAARPDDIIARLGGDEFGVLMVGIPSESAALAAERLLRRLGEPFQLASLNTRTGISRALALPVEASVGVALAPRHADTLETLLRCADVALHVAKNRRGVAVVYDPAHDPSLDDKLSLLADLNQAIAEPDGQIIVHYQPKVSLQHDRIVGAEALVRWQRPGQERLQPPDSFIPLAERCALIGPLTDIVLEQSVADCVLWQTSLLPPLNVAVNISPRVLLDRTFPSRVALTLARHGLPAALLTLEITETLAVSDSVVVEEVLEALHTLGVRLSVDDFGTGFSSLTFLTRLAVDEIKIDRQFVATMATDPKAASLIRTTVELAHRMEAQVVAEGVETAEQASALAFVGCDIAQGWHFARPLPHEALQDLILRWDAAGTQI